MDKFLSFVVWFCILGFITYQLLHELNAGKRCVDANGAMVLTTRLTVVCARRAVEQLDD